MTWWNRRNTKAITTLVKQIAALMAMLMVLSCAGCATSSPSDNEQSQSSDSTQTHEQVKKSAEQSIDGAHLRDNESLYKVYDTQFVHLYVKDETSGSDSFDDYGLYTQVEQLNKTALQAHGLDKNGQLYKVNYFEFHRDEDVIKLADDPDYDQTKFEEKLEIKGDNDHTKLIAMLNALNDYSVPMSDILGKYFDTENLAYWMAFQLLTGNTDTQSRNMYLYSPTNSDTFYVLDWDNDGMLMRKEYEIKQRSDGKSWENGISNYWGNMLFSRCLQTKSFRTALDKAIQDEYKYMNANRINSMVKHYRSITEQYVWKMPDSMHEGVTKSQYDVIANQLHSEIEQNYQTYQTGFNKPMPFYIGTPTPTNGKLKLNWDVSYDFNDEDLRYTVTVSKDYEGKDVVFTQSDLVLPEAVMDMPGEGQYFIKVSVRNASGETQDAFDYYITNGNKIYGTKCFYVKAGGSIVEDANVQ